MHTVIKTLILPVFMAISRLSDAHASPVHTQCGTDIFLADIQTAKEANFDAMDGASKAAIPDALLACLGHPDPAIRDGLAYEGLTTILRSGTLSDANIASLRAQLLTTLDDDDPDGFTAPFAALVLSEVARTDRIEPNMSAAERSHFVADAADYVSNVDDYRGYSDLEGWRHGVAHGADWLMQLALNPALTADDAALMLAAVRTQVPAKDGHAYIHGEPGRLARPVLFIALTGQYSESDWTGWLAPLLNPAPMDSWNDAYTSEASLARLHNVKSFLQALYVSASVSSNDALKGLLPPVTEALQALP